MQFCTLKYQYQKYLASVSPAHLYTANPSMMNTNSGLQIAYHILVVFFVILKFVQSLKKTIVICFLLESAC